MAILDSFRSLRNDIIVKTLLTAQILSVSVATMAHAAEEVTGSNATSQTIQVTQDEIKTASYLTRIATVENSSEIDFNEVKSGNDAKVKLQTFAARFPLEFIAHFEEVRKEPMIKDIMLRIASDHGEIAQNILWNIDKYKDLDYAGLLFAAAAVKRPDVFFLYAMNTGEILGPNAMKDVDSSLLKAIDNLLFTDQRNCAAALLRYINNMHEKPDIPRFKFVEPLSPLATIRLIGGSPKEAYTSTYLGLMDRLDEKLKAHKTGYDLLLSPDLPDYAVSNFLLNAAGYGQMHRVMKGMSSQKTRSEAMERFSNKENYLRMMDDSEKLDCLISMASAMGEMIPHLDQYGIRQTYEESIIKLYNEAYNNDCQKVVGVLIADYLNKTEKINNVKLFASVGYKSLYPMAELPELTRDNMFENGICYQQIITMNDDDGKSTHDMYLAHLGSAPFKEKGWQIEKKKGFTLVKSRVTKDNRQIIMAFNNPRMGEDGIKLMTEFLKDKPVKVYQMAGHSYHITEFMKYITDTMKYLNLRGCGGHRKLTKVQKINPSSVISATRDIGTMHINNPLMDIFNEQLLTQDHIQWNKIFDSLLTVAGDKRIKGYLSPIDDIKQKIGCSVFRKEIEPTRTDNSVQAPQVAMSQPTF